MPSRDETERLRATIEGVHAPPQLHARVAAQVAGAERARRRRGWALGGGVAAVAAAAAVVLAIVLPGGTARPTVFAVADLGAVPAGQPAPPVRRSYPETLDAQVGGVWFPSWRQAPGWRATGARRDAIGGRTALTVAYAGPAGRRLTYTIVSGPPLDWPPGARVQRRGGTAFRVVRHGGRTIVTWRERGHQCVIAATPGVPRGRLLALAAWAAEPRDA